MGYHKQAESQTTNCYQDLPQAATKKQATHQAYSNMRPTPSSSASSSTISASNTKNKEDAIHLRNLLKEHYTITEDWKGENFIGLNLKWDYEKRTVDLSIKDYVKKALQRFEHQPPKRAQHAPSKWTAPQYGAQIQMTEPADESPELDKQ